MPEAPLDGNGDGYGADREVVARERAELREFVEGLSLDDIKSGGWFIQLRAHALSSYTEKATWQYFQDKYAGLPADAIVDQRIKMAARYAAIEGGLSASAYTGAVVATIGSRGGASRLTVPAGLTTVMVDVAYITRLQLRLAHDIAVLYRVPLDTSDPDDLWKLIRVAFTIKSGEAVREGVVKVVPAPDAAGDQALLLGARSCRRNGITRCRQASPAAQRHQDRHPTGWRSARRGGEPLHDAGGGAARASRIP